MSGRERRRAPQARKGNAFKESWTVRRLAGGSIDGLGRGDHIYVMIPSFAVLTLTALSIHVAAHQS
jgi:hypothetical protein